MEGDIFSHLRVPTLTIPYINQHILTRITTKINMGRSFEAREFLITIKTMKQKCEGATWYSAKKFN